MKNIDPFDPIKEYVLDYFSFLVTKYDFKQGVIEENEDYLAITYSADLVDVVIYYEFFNNYLQIRLIEKMKNGQDIIHTLDQLLKANGIPPIKQHFTTLALDRKYFKDLIKEYSNYLMNMGGKVLNGDFSLFY